MEKARELQGYYGRSHVPCTIFEYEGWYCVEGGRNVNHTMDEIKLGVNIETLYDNDSFMADDPVECIEDLEKEVRDFIE